MRNRKNPPPIDPLEKRRLAVLELGITRNSVLFDTCVFVSAYDPKDPYYDHASDLISNCSKIILVPIAVVVEVWAVLVGSRMGRLHKPALNFLNDIQDPGRFIIFPHGKESASHCTIICDRVGVDVVDAMLVSIADELDRVLPAGEVMQIASYDRDFHKLRKSGLGHNFHFCDLQTDEIYPAINNPVYLKQKVT